MGGRFSLSIFCDFVDFIPKTLYDEFVCSGLWAV